MIQEESRKTQQMLRRQKARAKKNHVRRRKRKNRIYLARLAAFLAVVIFFGFFFFSAYVLQSAKRENKTIETVLGETVEKVEKVLTRKRKVTAKPEITEAFLTPNEYSRPQEKLEEVNNIFVHYTANASTTAMQNRSYFENLGTTGETSVSAHFIIGYEGEIIQCLPLEEIGYAVKGRNYDSISIECCYISSDGRFTEATYQSLIELSAWLVGEYDLTPDDILRHYDESGKNCPKYYVENENKWRVFIKAVKSYIDRNGVEVTEELNEEQEEEAGAENPEEPQNLSSD